VERRLDASRHRPQRDLVDRRRRGAKRNRDARQRTGDQREDEPYCRETPDAPVIGRGAPSWERGR
jgi:hypothetical protein